MSNDKQNSNCCQQFVGPFFTEKQRSICTTCLQEFIQVFLLKFSTNQCLSLNVGRSIILDPLNYGWKYLKKYSLNGCWTNHTGWNLPHMWQWIIDIKQQRFLILLCPHYMGIKFLNIKHHEKYFPKLIYHIPFQAFVWSGTIPWSWDSWQRNPKWLPHHHNHLYWKRQLSSKIS